MTDKKNKELSFESALEELQNILIKIENDNLTLDQIVEVFQRGTELTEYCKLKLDEAKMKITKLNESKLK